MLFSYTKDSVRQQSKMLFCMSGFSTIEIITCISIISIMFVSIYHQVIKTDPFTGLAIQAHLKSSFILGQTLAITEQKNSSITAGLESKNWNNITVSTDKNTIHHLNLPIPYKSTKFLGFLSTTDITINSNGKTYNNGSFFSLDISVSIHANKHLRLRT